MIYRECFWGDYAYRGYKEFNFVNSPLLTLRYTKNISLAVPIHLLVDEEENIYIQDADYKTRCYNTNGDLVWLSSIVCNPYLICGDFIYSLSFSTIYKIDKSNGAYSSISIPSGYKGVALNVCNGEVYVLLELDEPFNNRPVLGKIVGLSINIIQTYDRYSPFSLVLDPERNCLLIGCGNEDSSTVYIKYVNTSGEQIWEFCPYPFAGGSPSTDLWGRMFVRDLGSSPERVMAVDNGTEIIFNYLELNQFSNKPNGDFFGTLNGVAKSYNRDGELRWQQGDSMVAYCCNATQVLVRQGKYLHLLSTADGSILFSYPYTESVPEWVLLVPTGKGYFCIYLNGVDKFEYHSIPPPTSFLVVSTIPFQNANNVDPNANIQITFSDSLDTNTITTETLQVLGTYLEQYEYQWIYDDGIKTLTLTIPGGLETDASIIVNLTDGLKSTGGTALTPYALGFSTAKLPLQCDPPVILEPQVATCAKPLTVLQSPTPARARAKWRLHFRIKSFSDAGGTNLISTVDSSVNPELFKYSFDNGLTWIDFPADGLPKERYGNIVKVRCEIGPRKQVWLRADVGAEDA